MPRSPFALAFCLALGCRSPAAVALAEPYPLTPEMVLLEKDVRSEEYRKLLRAESSNVNVLNAEWQRIAVPDGAEGFAEAHGGLERVNADPALRAAYERRKEINERFLGILREEYAFRGQKAPFDAGEKPQGRTLTPAAAADEGLSIEPILPAPGAERHWPRWRGPGGMGLSAETRLPLRWSAAENVAWKTEVPGSGNSSPVIWGERIFLTTAHDSGKRRAILAFDRADGRLRPSGDARGGSSADESHRPWIRS